MGRYCVETTLLIVEVKNALRVAWWAAWCVWGHEGGVCAGSSLEVVPLRGYAESPAPLTFTPAPIDKGMRQVIGVKRCRSSRPSAS